MAKLVIEVETNEQRIAEANASNSIKMANSPFMHGVRFFITGAKFANITVDGKKSDKLYPVFTTSIKDTLLHLSTLMKSRMAADGRVLTPSGTLNNFVRECIKACDTNGQILATAVKGAQGRELIVRKTPYIGFTSDGRQYAAFLTEIDFMDGQPTEVPTLD